MSGITPTDRLVATATSVLERTVNRRGLLTRASLVAAAIASTGLDFVLRPGSAYSAVCGSGGSCSSGWTAMCCTINDGVNTCPPGTFAGGWWKATGARLCGGKPRYYVDCQAKCTKCGCGSGHYCAKKCRNCRSRCAKGSCDKRRTCHNLFRYGQCSRDITCSGPIACRAISCTPPWKWADCSTTAATDNATRGHSAACLPTWGALARRHTAMGSQGSVLGASIGRAYDGHRGRIQRYENGRMYWSKKTGAHWVNGALLARYRKLGQTKSPLGLPISDAFDVEGGRAALFRKGAIYQRDGRGAFGLWGTIWQRWRALGREKSVLGFPITNRVASSDRQGVYARFENGLIINGPATPTCAVVGPVAVKYSSLRSENGVLGYPIVEQRAVTALDGTRAAEVRFQKGSIVLVGERSFALWTGVETEWRRRGGASSDLGLPLSDVRRVDLTHYAATFTYGTLTYDTVTGTSTVSP